MKKILLTITALMCVISMCSCETDVINTTTPPSSAPTEAVTSTPTPTPPKSTETEFPVTGGDDTATDMTPTPTPTPIPTPTVVVDKFDSYTVADFDITYDKSGETVMYLECGKGLTIRGDLVIVNGVYGYNSKYTSSLASIREQREGNISVSGWSLQCTPETLKAIDAMSTAYEIAFPGAERNFIVQEAFKKSSDGGSRAYSSEYLTGLMLKLLFWDGEYTYKVDNNEMKAEKAWILNNCGKFGFVVRYPQAKDEITGVTSNNSEYRYVGVPHSYYMNESNLCLEEYLEKLRGYSFENRLEYIDPTGDVWQMYYVKAAEEGKTRVPVDKDAEYTLSGDNMGGFIVTVKKTDLKSIEYARLFDAISSLKNKNVYSYMAAVSLKDGENIESENFNVVMEEGSFKVTGNSEETVIYKDGRLYLTDKDGNTDSTDYTYESAMKKYLQRLGKGHSVLIVPNEDALALGGIESVEGGYVYTLYLRDTDLVNEQNIAYFGKTGVISKITLTITVKNKEVVSYRIEGKSSNGNYTINLDFNTGDVPAIEIPATEEI